MYTCKAGVVANYVAGCYIAIDVWGNIIVCVMMDCIASKIKSQKEEKYEILALKVF